MSARTNAKGSSISSYSESIPCSASPSFSAPFARKAMYAIEQAYFKNASGCSCIADALPAFPSKSSLDGSSKPKWLLAMSSYAYAFCNGFKRYAARPQSNSRPRTLFPASFKESSFTCSFTSKNEACIPSRKISSRSRPLKYSSVKKPPTGRKAVFSSPKQAAAPKNACPSMTGAIPTQPLPAASAKNSCAMAKSSIHLKCRSMAFCGASTSKRPKSCFNSRRLQITYASFV